MTFPERLTDLLNFEQGRMWVLGGRVAKGRHGSRHLGQLFLPSLALSQPGFHQIRHFFSTPAKSAFGHRDKCQEGQEQRGYDDPIHTEGSDSSKNHRGHDKKDV